MYYVNDNFKEKLALEENTPVVCIKLGTGNYWSSVDNFASGWSTSTYVDATTGSTVNIAHSSTEYRSIGGSSVITFYDDTEYITGDYGQISKSVVINPNTTGLRFWLNGTCNYSNRLFIQLYINSTLKIEKDLFLCRDSWNNQLEWIDNSVTDTTTVAIRVIAKTDFTDLGLNDVIIYIDDLEEFIPYNEDGGLFFTNFDQDFQYYDVSNYIQGSLVVGDMSATEVTYQKFPFKVTRSEQSLDRKEESVSIVVPIGDLSIMNAIMNLDDIRGQEVTIIDTFWEARRNAPDGGDHDCFKKDIYEVDAVASEEDKGGIVFSLKSKFVVNKVIIPLEPYERDFCRHKYKSVSTEYIAGCNYSGTLADCDKTLNGDNGCAVHNNSINFGAHPSIPSGRVVLG